jgi:hypothetical protein
VGQKDTAPKGAATGRREIMEYRVDYINQDTGRLLASHKASYPVLLVPNEGESVVFTDHGASIDGIVVRRKFLLAASREFPAPVVVEVYISFA